MEQELISMSKKELSRYDIIKDLINNKINGTDASKQIGVTVRHVKRLKRAVIKYGPQGLIHKNRNKKGNRSLPQKNIDKIEKLLKEKYYDFRPTHATEYLNEKEKIKISNEKVRLIMNDLGLWQIRPRKQNNKKKHLWRARKDNFGEMQQFDGSYHKWFNNIESCLLLSIDDATGQITHAKFDKNESVIAVFKFWLEYFEKNNLPMSIYLDKFSTYKINHANAVDNKELMTQFQRAMQQVGVKPITAHSPEAKGRVERVFGTLQNRLTKELRLNNINDKENANKYLQEKFIPKFNSKFSVQANRPQDLHKTINKELKSKLTQIFSIQNIRVVMNDYTIMFKTKYFQLNRIQPTTVYKKDKVIVEEHLDGSIKIRIKDYYLKYEELHRRPEKVINIKLPALTRNKQGAYKPPKDHPWRKPFNFSSQINRQKVLTKNN